MFHNLLIQYGTKTIVVGSPSSSFDNFGVFNVQSMTVLKDTISFDWSNTTAAAPTGLFYRKPGVTREDGDLEYIVQGFVHCDNT